jgi:SAM-dependent methyltransferase
MIKQLLKEVLAKKKCNVCNRKVYRFDTVSEEYIQYYKKAGFAVSFEDFETLNLQEYKCPHCGCNDRDRLIRLYIEEKILNGSNHQQQFLDIAPSTELRKSLQANEKISYRSADLYDADADDRVDIQSMDMYERERFDLIICSHVLEHVPDDKAALAEMYRVLKPGGSCILMVPIPIGPYVYDEELGELPKAEREKRFGQDDHMRLYTKEIFESRIQAAGFVLVLGNAELLGKNNFSMLGIATRSVLYIGKKKK